MSGWSRLDQAVAGGAPVVRKQVSKTDDEVQRESFLMGMFNLASMLAPGIAQQIDLSGRKRLLDLGGGPGTYAIHFCKQNPQLSGVVYDLPTTRSFAEKPSAVSGLRAASLSMKEIFTRTRYLPALTLPGFPTCSIPTALKAARSSCARVWKPLSREDYCWYRNSSSMTTRTARCFLPSSR